MTSVKLSDIISPAFGEVHRALKNNEVNEIVLHGGRGSAKSSYASVEAVLELIKHPDIHIVVMRKVANTLRTSVFAQYKWALNVLEVAGDFKSTSNPMEIVRKSTGQKIMFFGADDPDKVKSIKTERGYIGILHFEEVDQFAGDAEIRKIEQSVLRGGEYSLSIKVFNPPQTRANWMNQYVLEDKMGKLVHHSDYRTTPPEWLGPRFLADAEHLKEVNYHAYEHEYLGIANGTGGNVFDRLELREITDEEIKGFDRIYQGVDWGWYPDPFCFVRLHYDRARDTIFVIDEIVRNKATNDATAKIIKEKGYTDYYVTCDSAEPKSVSDFRAAGVNAKSAIKGPGSVEYGMKFLQGRNIVIDRKRTPFAYKEFTEYEYERTKDGEIMSGYPDANNHSIDAARYALERLYNKRVVSA